MIVLKNDCLLKRWFSNVDVSRVFNHHSMFWFLQLVRLKDGSCRNQPDLSRQQSWLTSSHNRLNVVIIMWASLVLLILVPAAEQPARMSASVGQTVKIKVSGVVSRTASAAASVGASIVTNPGYSGPEMLPGWEGLPRLCSRREEHCLVC